MTKVLGPFKVISAGMELEEWRFKSCVAKFGVSHLIGSLEQGWATLYFIWSKKENKGHASEILKVTKEYYEGQGLRYGGSVALSAAMRHLYEKFKIHEYRTF